MSANDFQVLKYAGETRLYRAEDWSTGGETSVILPGEPLKQAGTGTNFATVLATGDPEIGTDEFIGVAHKEGTHTSTADGWVEVTTVIPGKTVLRAKATTSTNVNTAAKLNELLGDWVSGDLTSVSGTNGAFTIDSNEGTDPNVHAFKIIGGDITKYTCDFLVHAMASEGGPNY